MHAPTLQALVVTCLALLAGCSEPPPAAPAPVATPPVEPAAPPVETENVTARYDCPTAGRMDIIRDGRYARLSMTDGRIVFIGNVQGSRPPVWSEVGLRFVIDGDFVELSQESGRAIACTETSLDTPADAAGNTDDTPPPV